MAGSGTSSPETGRCYVLPGVGAPLRLEHRAAPRPGAGEALVRIDACGVCGSDAFLQKGGFGADKLPVVPGHEAAGHVVAVGDDADSDWVGRQVAIYYISGPADSRWARSGVENIGPDIRRMGVDLDGAFSDYVVRPLATLVPVSPELDPATVAVATDALATPFHALTRIGRLQRGETLAVLGLGGIGSNAVQIGKHLGARVVAIGRSAAKLELAERLGADVLVRSEDGPEAVRREMGDQADVVVQCVGDPAMDRFAIDIAGFRARVVLVGTSLGHFTASATDFVWRELSLLGSRGFVRQDIVDVLDLVQAGTLETSHLTSSTRPLDEANAALDDLGSGRVLRTVLLNA